MPATLPQRLRVPPVSGGSSIIGTPARFDPFTHAAFVLPTADLEERYFDLLASIVGERLTWRSAPAGE